MNQSDVAKCPKSEKVHDEIAQGRVPLDKFDSGGNNGESPDALITAEKKEPRANLSQCTPC